MAYFKEWDEFVDISVQKYEIFREEGKKLYGFEQF
jgi:hypothetical protein